jgi:acetoin utilization protein AcuB
MTTTVADHMSRAMHTIGKEQTMTAAHEMMRKYKIRHLPVLEAGRVVGLVSDRDLHLMETLRDVNPDQVRVEDAMTMDPYTVEPSAPLSKVTAHMADHKLGSVVVVQDRKVVGIFTAVDGLRTLSELLAKKG